MLVGRIDISVGSQFAIVSVCAGLLAKAGAGTPLLVLSVLAIGAALGAANGLLVARLGLPSIIATLATLVAWRKQIGAKMPTPNDGKTKQAAGGKNKKRKRSKAANQ